MPKRTKQTLEDVRTLAIKLYNASRKEMLSQPKHIWGRPLCKFRDLPSESVAVWDAVAIRAYRLLKGHNAAGERLPAKDV